MNTYSLSSYLILSLIIIEATIMTPVNSISYNKEVDAGRSIYIVSPDKSVFLVYGEKLVFRILVFREDVHSIIVYMCGKPYKAVRANNNYPYEYVALIPVYVTDQYSWKIIITYTNGEVETTCIGVVNVTILSNIVVHYKILGINIYAK